MSEREGVAHSSKNDGQEAHSAQVAEMRARAERVLAQVARAAADADHARREWLHWQSFAAAVRRDDAQKRLDDLADTEQLARDVVALTDASLGSGAEG